ncbi:amidohydrolase family protein [Leisingera daeponensis]|uniref:amidohydrolase family protein n=1 Tax=Leisingera daeponensis TaxID=405746 RepID=UPI001377A26C|nr:amidohydrolase family protein [Leisingera daeponensis]
MGLSDTLPDTLRELTDRGVPLPEALAPFTSNAADLLKLHHKGRLKAGMDADMVVLDENLAVRHVMARGEWHVRDGQIARRGMYEKV